MRRRAQEIIEVAECTPLDAVIERLQSLRSSLSDEAHAAVKVEGNDIFGYRLNISYFREATCEEAELEARYSVSADAGAGALASPAKTRLFSACQQLRIEDWFGAESQCGRPLGNASSGRA